MILHSKKQFSPSVRVSAGSNAGTDMRAFVAVKMLYSSSSALGAISCVPSIQPDMRPVPVG